MSGHYCKTCDVDHGCDEHADCIRAEKEVEVLTAQLAASEAAALVVDAQAEALLERATAAEAARERAVAEVYAQETRIIEEGERRATAESALAEARRERGEALVAVATAYDAGKDSTIVEPSEVAQLREAVGTASCPICDMEGPHQHVTQEIERYRDERAAWFHGTGDAACSRCESRGHYPFACPPPNQTAERTETELRWAESIIGPRALTPGADDATNNGSKEGQLPALLRTIAMNDRTTYEHHESRPRDGREPEGGTIWLTPREMAIDALKALGEETESLYWPFRAPAPKETP